MVRAILGHKEKPLRLSKSFQEKVLVALGINIDENAWWATDYHYDWLAGALAVHVVGADDAVQKRGQRKARQNRSSQKSSDAANRLVMGNQEDADLVIASGSDLVLVEAKAFGVFTNKQMTSKLARLELLQQELVEMTKTFKPGHEVGLHLLLISPRDPQEHKPWPDWLKAWPDWLKRRGRIPWIKLDLSSGILDVSRCDNNGKRMVTTDYWRIGELASPISVEPKNPAA